MAHALKRPARNPPVTNARNHITAPADQQRHHPNAHVVTVECSGLWLTVNKFLLGSASAPRSCTAPLRSCHSSSCYGPVWGGLIGFYRGVGAAKFAVPQAVFTRRSACASQSSCRGPDGSALVARRWLQEDGVRAPTGGRRPRAGCTTRPRDRAALLVDFAGHSPTPAR